MRAVRIHSCLVVLLLVAACTGRGEESPYRVVRPTIAFEMLHDDPGLLVLDLRTPEEFRGPKGHLNTAENVPLQVLEQVLPGLGRFKESTILVYCRQGPCGAQGARILRSHGFEYVNLIEGGIDAWMEAGFGTVHEEVLIDEDVDEETFHYDLDEETDEGEDPMEPPEDQEHEEDEGEDDVENDPRPSSTNPRRTP